MWLGFPYPLLERKLYVQRLHEWNIFSKEASEIKHGKKQNLWKIYDTWQVFLGSFHLYWLTDLLNVYFPLHVSFIKWRTFMFILLLTNTEARQTNNNTFCKPEVMKTCMFNSTTSNNLSPLPMDLVSLNPGTAITTNTALLRCGLCLCVPSVEYWTPNTNAC